MIKKQLKQLKLKKYNAGVRKSKLRNIKKIEEEHFPHLLSRETEERHKLYRKFSKLGHQFYEEDRIITDELNKVTKEIFNVENFQDLSDYEKYPKIKSKLKALAEINVRLDELEELDKEDAQLKKYLGEK